uniref:Uncharacterized protein n=1 Tax=Ciona savignyi TaxID=51511 RepID=H2ZDX1_CIOSA
MTPQSVSEVHNAEISPAQQMPLASHVPAPAYGGVQYFNAPTPNKPSSMGRTKHKTSMKHKRKGGGLQYVRVKFAADAEEADIYKLSDVMYLDDSEVTSFDELEPGTHVVAKWPMNGKRYEAVVIDPLDNTGRRFRERKPPPKPFQAADVKLQATLNQPSIVLDKLDLDHLDMGVEDMTKKYDVSTGHEFGAYLSMADRIKLKRREMLLKEGAKKGKKRKRESESSDKSKRGLINTSDESEDETFVSPSRKRSHIVEHKKKER